MKIRETVEKADNLIEQGEKAKKDQLHFQRITASARSQLQIAYAQLEAASETSEDGKPMGDVVGARGAVYAAQAMLQSAERNLSFANRQLDLINDEKKDTIAEIERYTEAEARNISVLQQLQAKRFGGNASKFAQDVLARMNAGERAKQLLLNSMGLSSTSKNHTIGGISGAVDTGTATSETQDTPNSATTVKSSFLGNALRRKSKRHFLNSPQLINFSGLSMAHKDLLGGCYFVRGNNYRRYENVLQEMDNYIPVEPTYKNRYITIDARDIEGIRLNEDEALHPYHFWNRGHEYPTDSEEYFLEIASHIPEIFSRLDAGETITSIRTDPNLEICCDYYFAEPINVYEIDDYFVFAGAGRHRCMAAQRLGYRVPVKVIGKYDTAESLELQRMGIKTVQLSGCLSDNRKAVLNATKRMFKDHPELIGQLSEIVSKPIAPRSKVITFAEYGPTQYGSFFGGSLTINSDSFSNPGFGKELENLSAKGWYIPDATPESLIVHELAHGLHLELCALACKVKNGSMPEIVDYRKVIEQYTADTHAKTIVERACSDLGIEFESWEFSRNLSNYGGANYGEAFAEAISEVKCSKSPRPLAQAIYRHYLEYKKDLMK